MAIALDSTATSITNGFAGTVTKTWTHTVTGTNTLMVLVVDAWQDVAGTGSVTAASFNGVPMTFVGATNSLSMRSEIWYIKAPAPGAHTVSVTFTGDHDAIKMATHSFTGVDQVSPLDTYATATGTTGNPTVSMTTGNANELVIATLSRFSTTAATTNRTSLYNDATSSTLGASSYQLATTAGSYSDTYTGTANQDWSMVIAAFKPNTSTSNSFTQVATATLIGRWLGTAGAWMDVGTAHAKTEYQDGRILQRLRPYYYDVNSSGVLVQLTDPTDGANAYNTTNAADVKAHSTEQYVTITGNTIAKIRALITNSTNVANFKTTLKTFLDTTGFTGIDIDFEDFFHWNSTDYTNFKTFLSGVATYLHGFGYKVQVDLPAFPDATNEGFSVLRYADFNSIAVDIIAIMAYDYDQDAGAGYGIAPVAWVKNVCDYSISQITDITRIDMGIPSYGYNGTTGGTSDIVNESKTTTLAHTGSSGATRDPASSEMNWTNAGKSYFYNDTYSMDIKRAAIEAKGIRHVSVWVLGNNDWFAGIQGAVFTKTQPATARIQPGLVKTQTATARIVRVLTKTQPAIGRIANSRTITQTATARIITPPEILKTHLYKVYQKGKFMGLLPNVTSAFGVSQDLNTVGSQITISVAQSADTSALAATQTIDDESGNPITDEDSNNLLSEGAVNIVGMGADTTLIKNGNRVEVWEYSKWNHNGKRVFSGEMERWEASYGGDNQEEYINILVYSDGQDMDNHLVLGSPLVLDQTFATKNNNYLLQETNTDKITSYNRALQTFTVGGSVTNLGAIAISLQAYNVAIPVTVKVYPNVASANADTGVLGSATITVLGSTSTPTSTVVTFAFTTPIPVTAGSQYAFTVVANSSAGINIDYNTTAGYSGGDMYLSYYGGAGSPTPYTITPVGAIGSLSDMWFKTYSNAGATTAVFSTQDPSTGMLTSIMDSYNAEGGLITYGGGSIQATGLSLSYTFNTSTVLEGLGTILNLAPYGYYFYVDLGTNVLNFKQASGTADIMITKGKEIEKLTIIATIENVKNTLLFTGGLVSTTNLFRRYHDATSVSQFGVRLDRRADNRVLITGTADAIGNSFIAENKDEQFQTTVTLLDSAVDTSSIKVGQIVGFRGFGTFADRLLSQIVRIDYTTEEAVLTLGILPPRTNITLAQITRNLLAQQTIDNPSSPS